MKWINNNGQSIELTDAEVSILADLAVHTQSVIAVPLDDFPVFNVDRI